MTSDDPRKPPVCSPPPAVVPLAMNAFAATDSAARHARPIASDTLLHWVFLLLAAIVLCASCTFRVRDGEQVIVPVVNEALPGTCTFQRLTGVPCPGCGLTRSFISLGHGQLLAAWRYNPAGFVFFAVVAFQVPYRIYQIIRIHHGSAPHRFEYLDNWILVVLVVVLVAQWLWGLVMRL